VATKTKLLPAKWRTKLREQVDKTAFPELEEAFDAAALILAERTDDEVEQLAQYQLQLIAKASPVQGTQNDQSGPNDPRLVYCAHASAGAALNEVLDPQVFRESLAVGTLLALALASDVFANANCPKSWRAATQAIANARAFGEWIYILDTVLSDENQIVKFLPRGFIRAAAKRKVSKKASKKTKSYWDAKLAPEKQKVFKAYDDGGPWTNVKAAAEKIHGDMVTTAIQFDKLYKWLLGYQKSKKEK
jgi:hypothetical protein